MYYQHDDRGQGVLMEMKLMEYMADLEKDYHIFSMRDRIFITMG